MDGPAFSQPGFFACAVVVGIVLLPSLYAWLNIYSNWDPYGNTGGISIAVASLDEGYDDDGTYVNKGQDVVDDLREATSINWVIVNTEKEATDGVCAGDYYAAVVIDRDFSAKMYRMLTDWTESPPSPTTRTPRKTPWPPRSPTRRWRA